MSGLTTAAVPDLVALWRTHIDDYVNQLAWSPDGSVVAAVSTAGSIVLLDASSGSLRVSLDGHAGGAFRAAWSSDSTCLATCGQDGRVRLWAQNGTPLFALPAGGAWVEHVAWTPDGKKLITAAGRIVRIWTREGELLGELPSHVSTVAGLAVRGDGRELATICYGALSLWRLDRLSAPPKQMHWKGSLIALAWSPDGKVVATGCQDASVHVWYARNARDLEMNGYPIKVRELAWDSSSRYLATGGSSDVTLWDFSGKGPAGSSPVLMSDHQDYVSCLAFAPASTHLASGCRDAGIRVWDVVRPQQPLGAVRLRAAVTSLAWEPNGGALAAGDASGEVSAWRPHA